jgi:CBS domain-containing protein
MSRRQVADVMTREVISVAEDTPFRQIVDVLEKYNVSAVPVVDGGGLVVGVVSEADLLPKMELAGDTTGLRLFEGRKVRRAREKAGGEIARELMTAPAVTALEVTPVVVAAKRMEDAGVKRLPVVNLAGRLIGIVSRHDLLKVFLRTDAEILDDVRRDIQLVPGVDAGQVWVEVDAGVVTLTGQVANRSALETAAVVAARVDGVIDVINRMTYPHDDLDRFYIQPA